MVSRNYQSLGAVGVKRPPATDAFAAPRPVIVQENATRFGASQAHCCRLSSLRARLIHPPDGNRAKHSMSKYHPLDVRHPANRDLRARNFLLDPPAQDQGTPSKPALRDVAPPKTNQATSSAPSAPAHPVNPWGQRGQAVDNARPTQRDPDDPATQRKRPSLLRWLIIGGVLAYAATRPGVGDVLAGLLDDLTDLFDARSR
jgi:hypothetical protein